jgi:hypothetical protein
MKRTISDTLVAHTPQINDIESEAESSAEGTKRLYAHCASAKQT